MNTNTIIQQAIMKAMALHAGQKRKGGGDIPYIVHPLEVAFIVTRYTNTTKFITTAILHDTVEDCSYSLTEVHEEFGEQIKDLVAALSEDKSIKDWAERKNENLRRLRLNQDAYFIKSADALANMRSLVASLRENGAGVWQQFNATKAEKLNYFQVILDDTVEIMPKKMLEDYVAALKDLEYSEAIQKHVPLGFSEN